MKIHSFDSKELKKKDKKEGFYDVFRKNTKYNNKIQLHKYVVPREREMRLDLISKDIYDSPDYVEELMLINNLISPYSVKQNQEIYFCALSSMNSLYVENDDMENDDTSSRREILTATNNKRKYNEQSDENLPLTVKPKNLKQVTVDTKNRKIKIINSFK